MGMYVMCQICYYYWDAADKILKVVYCTRLASDVLITKVKFNRHVAAIWCKIRQLKIVAHDECKDWNKILK